MFTLGKRPKRKLFFADLCNDSDGEFHTRRLEVETTANVASSLAENGLHYPALDIDFSTYVIPSTTEGHYHLYLDIGLSWEKYKALLIALGDAGILQPGYVSACIEREMTFVRLPWCTKGEDREPTFDELNAMHGRPPVAELPPLDVDELFGDPEELLTIDDDTQEESTP